MSKNPIDKSNEDLGFWLRIVSNNFSHSLSHSLEELGITLIEWIVLSEIHETPQIALSSIAERIGLTRGAISKIAERLVQKKLILRKESEEDRRFQVISITTKGLELMPSTALCVEQTEIKYYSGLSATERKQLLTLLKKIASNHHITNHWLLKPLSKEEK